MRNINVIKYVIAGKQSFSDFLCDAAKWKLYLCICTGTCQSAKTSQKAKPLKYIYIYICCAVLFVASNKKPNFDLVYCYVLWCKRHKIHLRWAVFHSKGLGLVANQNWSIVMALETVGLVAWGERPPTHYLGKKKTESVESSLGGFVCWGNSQAIKGPAPLNSVLIGEHSSILSI